MSPAECVDRLHRLDAEGLGEVAFLSLRQWAALALVAVPGTPTPATIRGVARSLNCGRPAITRAMDAFSKLGLAIRRRDPKDGRSVFLHLTDKGRRAASIMFGPAPGEAVAVAAGRR